jgi:hypothetical protein
MGLTAPVQPRSFGCEVLLDKDLATLDTVYRMALLPREAVGAGELVFSARQLEPAPSRQSRPPDPVPRRPRIFAFLSVPVGHLFYGDLAAFASGPDVAVVVRAAVSMLLPLVQFGGAAVVVFFLVGIHHHARAPIRKAARVLIQRVFGIYPLYMVAVRGASLWRSV